MTDKVIIYGGGTFNHVSCHLALAAPAFGATARRLYEMLSTHTTGMEPELILTKMADHTSSIVTTDDLIQSLRAALKDENVKAIIMNAAICDFVMNSPSGEPRLSSKETYNTRLIGVSEKIIDQVKEERPDIILAGFKTTKDASYPAMLSKAFAQVANSGVDFCFANDVGTHVNALVGVDGVITKGSREHVLDEFVCCIGHLYMCKQMGVA